MASRRVRAKVPQSISVRETATPARPEKSKKVRSKLSIETIAEIIGEPEVTSAWKIFDISKEDHGRFVLTDCVDNNDKNRFEKVVGTIVDTKTKKIACPSCHFFELAPSGYAEGPEDLLELNEETQEIKTTTGYKFSAESTLMIPSDDGFLVRAWKDSEGVAHLSSSRKFDFLGSPIRRETGPILGDLYRSLGGLNPEGYFDPKYKYSNFVHYIFIISPHTLIASRNPTPEEYLLYLGAYSTGETVPKDFEPYPFIPPLAPTTEEAVAEKKLRAPFHLSVQEANDYINWGSYADDKALRRQFQGVPQFLRPGESIYLINTETTSKVPQRCKITSGSYQWRAWVRSFGMRLKFNLASLIDAVQNPNTRERPPYDLVNVSTDELMRTARLGKMTIPPKSGPLAKGIHKAWLTLIYAVPLHMLKEAYETYNEYMNIIERVAGNLVLVSRDQYKFVIDKMDPVYEELLRKYGNKKQSQLLDQFRQALKSLEATKVYRLNKFIDDDLKIKEKYERKA